MRRSLRSLRTTIGIIVPLVLALGVATAVALAPAASQRFDVAAAPSESYELAKATFAPVSASGFTTIDETGYAATATVAPAPLQPDSSTPATTAVKRAVLTVRMSASRDQARPGEQITYTVVVGNVGTADATSVVAESHVPEGTTMNGGSGCVEATAGSPCIPVDESGDGNTSAGHISHAFDDLHPGNVAVWRFTVTVSLDTPVKTVLKNHAHAQARDAAPVTSDDVFVTVL